MNVTIKGLDKLQRDLEDAQRAFQSLDGTIATLKFNPGDPYSVQSAIRQMEAAIDSKTVAYRGNALVPKVAKAMKDKYRERIIRARTSLAAPAPLDLKPSGFSACQRSPYRREPTSGRLPSPSASSRPARPD